MSIDDAIRVQNYSAALERERFVLRDLAPGTPPTHAIRALSRMVSEIADQIDNRHASQAPVPAASSGGAYEAFSNALHGISEALSQLGRTQMYAYNPPAAADAADSELAEAHLKAEATYTDALDHADNAIRNISDELRMAARRVAPPPASARALAARSRSSQAQSVAITAPALSLTVPLPAAAASTAGRGRS